MRFAARLTRLYPRRWRARYEEEMLALLEQTGLGVFRALDLMQGALFEWTYEAALLSKTRFRFRFLLPLAVTGVIAALGLVAASWLTSHVVTPPSISLVDGQRAVLPPRLPSFLGGSWYVLVFIIFIGEWRAYRAAKASKSPSTLRAGQALGHLAALAGTVPLAFWSALVAHYGTGLPPAPGIHIFFVVLMTFSSLQTVLGRISEPSDTLLAHGDSDAT
jgi:hypothetical protein